MFLESLKVLFLLNWVSNGVFNLEVSSLLFVLFDLALSTSLSIIISLLPSLQCHHALLYSILGKLENNILCLPSIQTLDLTGNWDLEGSLLKSNWSSSSLNFLDLSINSFSGLLPSSLFNLPNLSTLDLGYNQLVGPLPSHSSISCSEDSRRMPTYVMEEDNCFYDVMDSMRQMGLESLYAIQEDIMWI
nr:putative lrr receptor-like serine/threonine-protein kinase [Quercus suber]